MRLALLALSAAALTGCSWHGNSQHGAPHQWGVNPACQTVAGAPGAYGHQSSGYQHMSYGYGGVAGCATGAYGAADQGFHGASYQGHASQGYGTLGNAPQGYTTQAAGAQYYAGQGGLTAQGVGGQSFGQQAYGFQGPTATTLGAAAPYGAAVGMPSGAGVGAAQSFSGQGFAGQSFAGGGVQTVVGAPIYVPQPYPAPYGVPQLRGQYCCGVTGGGGGGMPFGVELFGGIEMDSSGKLFTKKSNGPPDGDYSIGIEVGEINPISYADAFGDTTTIGGALSYDVSRNTTILGAVSASSAEGQTVDNYTTVQTGSWSGTTFTPTAGSSPRALDGTFSDLDLLTVEAGLRQYFGHNPKLRPYVAGTAGISHNNDVEFVQTYADDGTLYGQRRFIDSGWNPTASAVLGTEVAVTPRAAIGVETGIRWRDNMSSVAESEDRISIPVTVRGRLAF